MDISLNIILDRLSQFQLEKNIELPTSRKFCRAELPGNPLKTLSVNSIYVANLSQILSIGPEKRKDIIFICLRDRESDAEETPEVMSGIIVVSDDISFETLFTSVQDIFFTFENWLQNAQDTIIKNGSLQDIIDLSEDIIENYVQITDSSFKLLGYTKGIECDEEITVLARKYGFHPESTIKKFNKYHRIQLWERSDGIIINRDHNVCTQDIVSKVFRFGNTYFAHAAMVCNNVPLSDGLIDVFNLFMEIIGVFVEKDWQNTNDCHHIYDSFLRDLYEGLMSRKENIEERARHVGVPTEGSFCLSVTSAEESGQHPVSMIAKDIIAARPEDKIVIMNGRVTILSILPQKNSEEPFEKVRKDLDPVLGKYNLRCGISEIFDELTSAPHAMTQALQALSFSGKTPGVKLPYLEGAVNGLESRTASFDESLFYILLGNSEVNKDVWQGSVYYRVLKQLNDYDTQHNMNNLFLLYVYLVCESRAAEAGSLLHMSRNNIVYRVDRISQMINLDLKQPAVRAKLLVSYIMLQLYGFE